MPWYRAGTVNVTNGSTAVVGATTAWVAGGVALGDVFTTDNVTLYEIQGIADDTHLTLDRPYAGATASGASYAIIRNLSPPGAAMMTSVTALTQAVGTLIGSGPSLGLASAFQVTAQSSPNLTVQVASGMLQVAGAPTVIAAQTLTVLSAPVSHPRLDLVVLDLFSGTVSIVEGTEAVSPAYPTKLGSQVALAGLQMSVGMTAVTSLQITDLRPLFEDGLTSGRINVKSYGAIGDINSHATAYLVVPNGLAAGATVTINGTTITGVSGTPSGAQWQVSGSNANTLVAGTVNDVTRLVSAINANIANVTARLGAGTGQILLTYNDPSLAGNSVGVAGSAGFTVTDVFGNTQTTLTNGARMTQTPNAVALQNAINAATLAAAGWPFEIFIPDGIYLCEATLYLPSNIRLRGVGSGVYGTPGTHLIRNGNYPLIVSTGVSSTIDPSTKGLVDTISIEDICLDGGDSSGAGACATATITFSGPVAVGNSVTHRGVTFTAVAAGVALTPTTFTGGVSLTADLASLLAQLNASPSYLIQESTYRISTPGTIQITALAHGTAGNGYSLSKSGTNISVSGSTLSGGGVRWTADLVQFSACYEFKLYRVWFTSCAGRALRSYELWDSRIHDCRFTFCGSQDGTLPAISFNSSQASPNYETTNNIYLWGCRFESNPGVAVEVSGNNGVDVWFTQCKFEHVASQLDYLVRCSQATGVHFDTCWMFGDPYTWFGITWSLTSSTAVAPSVGTVSFTGPTGSTLIFAGAATTSAPVGLSVVIYETANPTNWMTGRVSSYTSSTGAITVITDQASGSTTATAWTMAPCHPGLLYCHGCQHIQGKIIGGVTIGNPAAASAVYQKAFAHFDACYSSDLHMEITQGTTNLITASLTALHDTTTTGSVGHTQGSGSIGQSNFTVEAGRNISVGSIVYVYGDSESTVPTSFAYNTATDYMVGQVLAYNNSTGALQISVDPYGWGGVAADQITRWRILTTPARANIHTNPPPTLAKVNITGAASPYGNFNSTLFGPTATTLEGVNIEAFTSPTIRFQNLALQDQLLIDHLADFTTVGGVPYMSGQYRFYVYDFNQVTGTNGYTDIFRVDGNRALNIYTTMIMRNVLRWYDGDGGTYNQLQIKGSVFGTGYLPVDGAGNLTGSVGDIWLNSNMKAGSYSLGSPLVERYVCVAPNYTSGSTVTPATYMHPPPLQLSGTRASAPASGAIAYGYAQGTYYEYTDPISGDFEGVKVVSNGTNLVWKTVRPISA